MAEKPHNEACRTGHRFFLHLEMANSALQVGCDSEGNYADEPQVMKERDSSGGYSDELEFNSAIDAIKFLFEYGFDVDQEWNGWDLSLEFEPDEPRIYGCVRSERVFYFGCNGRNKRFHSKI